MKLNKIIYVVPLAVLIFTAGSGCRKGQFNINKNINNPTDSTVTYDVVLPAALNASGGIIARNWGPIQNWMSFWARSGTYAPNVIEETYQITTGFGNGVWNNCYDNNYDYQIIQTKANQAGAGFYEGIARIMKAQNFQILVDVYGNVPYTEALKGSINPTPKYDKGLFIYQSCLREIDAGLALINAAVVTSSNANKNIATNDIMFGGNKVLWNKFGNTLKLRMLIHCYALPNVAAPAGIDKPAEIAIITSNGNGFLTTDAQVNPGYTGNDKPNSFYNQYITNTDGSGSANNIYYKANEWGIEYYAYNGDNRESRFYVAGSGGLIGAPYGLPPIDTYKASVVAGIGPGLNKGATAPQWILTAAESYFLQAEAAHRGILPGGTGAANTYLTNAINASFAFVGASVGPYFTNNATWPDVDYLNGGVKVTGGPSGGIFTILSQKWFALNGINTLEVWSDWRRVPYSEVATRQQNNTVNASTTNFVYGDGVGYTGKSGSLYQGPGPFRSVAPQIQPTDQIPVRYLYPQTEYNYNTANVAGEGTVGRYTPRIFWDLN